MILKKFVAWAEQFQQDNTGTTVEVKVCEPTDNPAAWLTVLNSAFAGRITAWSSGDFVIDVLNYETADGVYFEHGEIQIGDDLDMKFKAFVETMKLRKKPANKNDPG